MDLKQTVARYLTEIIGPIRDKLVLGDDLTDTVKPA